MIIGAGMFGIPFSFAEAGFWLGTLELVVITGIILIFHLLYGDIVLAGHEFHRMPGYMRLYLGRFGGIAAWASALFGISGTLLAYTLLGSLFLRNIFSGTLPLAESWWAYGLIGIVALTTAFPVRREALINGVLTALLVLFIIFLVVFLLPHVRVEHTSGFNPGSFFAPYGVLLFALSGGIVIPDLITILGRERTRARAAIMIGTLLPAVLYFLFAFVVVGVLGDAVSPDAISGLMPVVGHSITLLGNLVGLFAILTSFVVLSASFQALLRLDYKLSAGISWIVVSFLPFVLYLLGIQNFIVVIGAIGAIAIGIDSALVVAAHAILRQRTKTSLHFFSYVWRVLLVGTLIAGVFREIYILWQP